MRQLEDGFHEMTAGQWEAMDFNERINFWHAACGLPSEARAGLQRLRMWRNASVHHDKQRWLQEGPRDASEAREHIASLQARLRL